MAKKSLIVKSERPNKFKVREKNTIFLWNYLNARGKTIVCSHFLWNNDPA